LQSHPALDTPVDSAAVRFVHSPAAILARSPAPKAGCSRKRSAFGGAAGNIAVAHKPDEYVSEAQMAACDSMLAKLVERLST
jgi:acetylornithine deacetylase/succinyl-diaminopimelate desuccinylase-like protein